MGENIERIFMDEVREKKRTGYGAFHKAGKGILSKSNKALRTPYFFMKSKERNKLNGAVETHNIFETILDWEEFSTRDRASQKMLLTKWRELYSNREIIKKLQVGRGKDFNTQSFADLVNDLGCPAKKRTAPIKRTSSGKKKSVAILPSAPKQTLLELETEMENKAESRIIELVPAKKPQLGLSLEYHGEFDQEQLSKIFTKLQLLIDGETNKFRIDLTLTEIE